MLIHSAMRSTQGNITAELWPTDIDQMVYLYNIMPREDSGMSTSEIWGRSSFLPSKDILPTLHTWGAPTYIIEPKLQKRGYHILKWAPQICRRVLLGFTRIHYKMVGLILNLHTWSIPPQFHVVYGDIFTTVEFAHNEEVVPKIWTNIITNPDALLHVSLDEDTKLNLADEWLETEEVQEREAACFQWIDQQHSLR